MVTPGNASTQSASARRGDERIELTVTDSFGAKSILLKRMFGENWAPARACGPPDTNTMGDIPTAWASLTPDSQAEWLELDFDWPVVAKSIRVYETNAPGALWRVSIGDASGEMTEGWSGTDPAKPNAGGILVADIAISSGRMVSKKEILEVIQTRYSLRLTGRDQESAPSVDFELTDGSGDIGVIASVTEPFCFGCTRARLTADGKLVTCLFSNDGHDLKTLMRSAATDEDLLEVILAVWPRRADRYSEERLEAMHSRKGYEPRAHKKIEMIRLGG